MINKKNISTILFYSGLTFLFLTSTFERSNAQTVYKQTKGVFTGLPSFSIQGSGNDRELLLGPWMGYRFNEIVDLLLHMEYFSGGTPDLTLVNVGVRGGYTHHMPRIKWRTVLSLYRAFNMTTGSEIFPSPEAFTVGGSTLAYYSFQLSNRVSILPNVGLFARQGTFKMPYTRIDYLSGHTDGFLFGSSFGMDLNVIFSSKVTATIGVGYELDLSGNNNFDSGFRVAFLFNF